MVYIGKLSKESIEIALQHVNEVFSNNVEFKSFKPKGRRFIVTLTVKTSFGEGARRGFAGRRVKAACWHVYGLFFYECFRINPQCIIISNGNHVIPSTNWKDVNIGSFCEPLMYSDACNCRFNANLMCRLLESIGGLP